MLKIYLPNNHQAERRYCIDTVFGEFLDLSYHCDFSEEATRERAWIIETAAGKRLRIEDHFFSHCAEPLDYLDAHYIPQEVSFYRSEFSKGVSLPVLFGGAEISGKSENVICRIDLFATVFFMLTRWEEYVDPTRDQHGRFPATTSTAFRFGFLDQPIVNDYCVLLRNLLKALGEDVSTAALLSARLYPTHDVDILFFWKDVKQLARIAAADLFKRKAPLMAFDRVWEYASVRLGRKKDPYDTFDWLMDMSERYGLQSRFYFLCGGQSIYDTAADFSDAKVAAIVKNIIDRGHIVGLHPSYETPHDPVLFAQEKRVLEDVLGKEITESRQHYLRFEAPFTWRIAEENGIAIDNSCGYADREGFRCGTGNVFTVFDFLQRRTLKLKERPLVFMDSRDHTCGGFVCKTQFDHRLFDYIAEARSDISILFHNCIFHRDKTYIDEYQKVLNVWHQRHH